MSLPLVLQYQGDTIWGDLLVNKYVLLSITVLSAFVMNAEIPLFSLKIKNFSVAKYKLQIGFVLFSVALIVLLKVVAVPLIIVSYVVLSVLNTIFSKKELA
jgi:CDP-diacylglycerol--serine O-phosphatidyltransferase